MTITWNNGTRGFYTATLTTGFFDAPGNGYLKGTTKDLANPSSTADWFSERGVFSHRVAAAGRQGSGTRGSRRLLPFVH